MTCKPARLTCFLFIHRNNVTPLLWFFKNNCEWFNKSVVWFCKHKQRKKVSWSFFVQRCVYCEYSWSQPSVAQFHKCFQSDLLWINPIFLFASCDLDWRHACTFPMYHICLVRLPTLVYDVWNQTSVRFAQMFRSEYLNKTKYIIYTICKVARTWCCQ